MAIVKSEPTGWASWNARITTEDREVAILSISTFKNKGAVQLDGDDYTMEPHGVWGGAGVLRKGASVIAQAKKPSFFRRTFEISSAGHHFRLESRSWTGREYALVVGGQEVGRIHSHGLTGRKVEMEFPDEVPLVLQLFLLYLVLVQHKREAAAASSGS